MLVPKFCKEIAKIFSQAGFCCYLVGGAVRNRIAGLSVSDYDLATDAQPQEVCRLFRHVIPTGIKHGTVTVLYKGTAFETTTFRADGLYTDSRRPDSVEFVRDIDADLSRRDFTINALAQNCLTGEILDPHNGTQDIRNKIIRTIGDPVQRFSEDGLRILRACRFASQLEYQVEESTLQGMKSSLKFLSGLSAERIQEELKKILKSEKPSIAFSLMHQSGVLPILLPELEACYGVEQRGWHAFDVFRHSLYACDAAPQGNLEVRLAALLHDIGKHQTQKLSEQNTYTFYGHETVSHALAKNILSRLKFPNSVTERTLRLILHHMFHYEPHWTDASVRRFIRRTGLDLLDDLFALRLADITGMTGVKPAAAPWLELKERIDAVLSKGQALSVSDLQINGDVLHSEAGIPKGPVMGKVLAMLLEAVLDDPALNEQTRLLTIARNFYQSRIVSGEGEK